MSREFKFKETHSNIEKFYHYVLYKFPNYRSKLDYDEWGQFVMFKKNENITIFYYVNGLGNLCYNVYKNRVAEIDKPIITDFKHKVYPDENLKKIFDKILKPLT